MATRIADWAWKRQHPTEGPQVWSRVDELPRWTRCSGCRQRLAPGRPAWRPPWNADNRDDRLCQRCVERPECPFGHTSPWEPESPTRWLCPECPTPGP